MKTQHIVPKVDPDALEKDTYIQKQLKTALDAVTAELLADYCTNHLLSRGAPVGSA